ncbi:hypothetical protein F5887DRAFT_1223921 [Amanita rubescens]|nr:hypothetical protein F5887DRAFT_1223921 [Amanita rubescens]
MVFAIVRVPLGLLLWLAGILLVVRGFDFSVSPPTQCDPLNISWSGGQPPFQLLVIPPNGTIRNISIPVSAFDDGTGNGSYVVQQLPLPQGSQLMLSMSDAMGIFSGGTSALMTVGASPTQQVCNTTDPGPDFYFSLDSTLAQFLIPFTQYGGAVLPITILVNIPQGQSFAIRPPQAGTFNWIANLTAGTLAAFSVYDSENRVGGTSSIRVVQFTNNTSCLTSTVSPATSPTPTSTPTNNSSSSANKTLKGLAIGISIGALGLLGFVGLIGFYWCRQSKLHRAHRPASSFVDLTYDPNGTSLSLQTNALQYGRDRDRLVPFAMTHAAMPANTVTAEGDARRVSYVSSVAPSIGHRSMYQPQPFLARSPQSNSQPRNSKWSIQNQDASATPTEPTNITYPSEIVMHRDISESLDGPIELPPRYSADRPPLPGFPNSTATMQNRGSV